MTYTIQFTKTKRCPVDESMLQDALEVANKQGWHVTDVEHEDENKGCWVGFCEVCGLPIFADDDYHSDEDGVYWHKVCDGEVSCDE